jgi:WD repeat-containing protein 26
MTVVFGYAIVPPTLNGTSSDVSQHARLLINEQKYLEFLENQNITAALNVLRNELAPMNIDSEQLHTLSRSASIHHPLI